MQYRTVYITEGVKELGELLDFLIAQFNLIFRVAGDGKVDPREIGALISGIFATIPLFKPAFEGTAKIPSELTDLSADEQDFLEKTVISKLEHPKLKVAAMAKFFLSAALTNARLISEARKIFSAPAV